MDLDSLIAQYHILKHEQKLRRIEFVGPDWVFYETPTEKLVTQKLEDLKLEMNVLFKNQK